MDVIVFPYIIFIVYITLGLQNTSASISEFTLNTDDGNRKCSRKYTTCTLSLDGIPIMERGEKGEIGIRGRDGTPGKDGEKGEKGIPGLKGRSGDVGAKGDRGDNGRDGIPGKDGEKGDQGMPGLDGIPGKDGKIGDSGLPGYNGLPGDKGERGDRGYDGLPGINGEKGYPGDNGKMGPAGPMGLEGPVGPPGVPGQPGICPCSLPSEKFYGSELDDEFGTRDTPAEVPCKAAPDGVKSGIYYLGPKDNPIEEVYCNMTSRETCIRRHKSTPERNHNSGKGIFWLSGMEVHMKELYDLTTEQLTWLRERSVSVRQTLKYNCLDSVPYPKRNLSSSVQLLTWNDAVIGPYPTNKSPFFYSVPPATDECKEGSTEWKSTIIELQSSNVFRLPIIDLWIADIRNADQKMSIESVELCFG